MFGVGITEFLFIMAIAMIVLGPDRLPEAMGQLGRMVRKVRTWAYEFRAEFDEEIQLLRGEVEALQREAELTRQELQEIHDEVAATVGEAQEDLDNAAQDIATELGSATEAADAQIGDAARKLTDPSPTSASARPPAPKPAAAGLPFVANEPADAMASAISQAFAPASNGGPAEVATPVPAAARWQGTPEPEPVALPEGGVTMARFSPENGQYAALLRATAGAGSKSLGAGREALRNQGRRDAGELGDYAGKGPMAAALLWAGSVQAHIDGDAIQIEREDDAGQVRVTVSLTRDPFGLERPIDAPAARLARFYDRAFFAALGLAMEEGSLLAEGAQQTRFVLTDLPASEADDSPA